MLWVYYSMVPASPIFRGSHDGRHPALEGEPHTIAPSLSVRGPALLLLNSFHFQVLSLFLLSVGTVFRVGMGHRCFLDEIGEEGVCGPEESRARCPSCS